jgi:hypothetical protein
MSLVDSLAGYLTGVTKSTLGQTLFIGEAPSSKKVVNDIWWIVDNGGSIITKNATGEATKSYQFNIFFRSRDYELVKTNLATLEEDLNCDGCSQLSGYDTIDIEATSFPIDQDLDGEDRKIGLLQVTITTYKECE